MSNEVSEKRERKINIKSLLSKSNILFYPGAGWDVYPIKVFNTIQQCNLFIYSDYGVKLSQLNELFYCEGYEIEYSYAISDKELFPYGYQDIHLDSELTERLNDFKRSWIVEPYQHLFCFKKIDKTVSGANGFKVLYIARDGFSCYYNLFKNYEVRKNFKALVLKDHGFGCNYSRFGKEGLLDEIAQRYNIFPQYVLCAMNTPVWDDYKSCNDKNDDDDYHQFLYERINTAE